jgi:diacylglycerol kinase (ATP)
MASILVIRNPVAGRMRVQSLWPQVERGLKQAGVDFDAVATRAPREATALARAAVGNYSAVVGVGGDGTMSEIVNGLLQASAEQETVPLGMIPLGNGDDFAKVLPPEPAVGKDCFDWRTAIQKIAAGNSRLYDVGCMRGDNPGPVAESRKYFLNVVDVGFGAHTVQNFVSVPKFLTGDVAYLAAVFKTMVDYPALRLTIQIGGEPPFEQITTLTAVSNGRCFGGGFWVCPQALPDDGLFDVMVAQEIDRLTILRLLPKIRRGTHIYDPLVKMHRARRVVLESSAAFLVEADGEMPIPPTCRLELDILPRKLRVIV